MKYLYAILILCLAVQGWAADLLPPDPDPPPYSNHRVSETHLTMVTRFVATLPAASRRRKYTPDASDAPLASRPSKNIV